VTVLCEGETEFAFVNLVLAPYFGESIYFEPISLNGSVDVDKFIEMATNCARGVDFATTMIDWYGLPKRFHRKFARAKTAEEMGKEIEAAVGEVGFFMYFQRYEFEALILADVEKIGKAPGLKVSESQIDALRKVVRQFGNPEVINGIEPPSIRIQREIEAYNKVAHGPAICQAIGIEVLRRKCRHFGAWLARLEALAG
jgi:hypothetical protein